MKKKKMDKRKISIILNLALVIFGIIGFYTLFRDGKGINTVYYTEDSNILAIVSSLIFVVYLIANKKIPRWLKLFKYVTTLGLTVTMLVSIIVLVPLYNWDYYGLLIVDPMEYLHLICPTISLVTFLFFDGLGKFDKKDAVFGLSFTILYSIVIIPLNIFKVITGPYPFLHLYEQTVFVC